MAGCGRPIAEYALTVRGTRTTEEMVAAAARAAPAFSMFGGVRFGGTGDRSGGLGLG